MRSHEKLPPEDRLRYYGRRKRLCAAVDVLIFLAAVLSVPVFLTAAGNNNPFIYAAAAAASILFLFIRKRGDLIGTVDRKVEQAGALRAYIDNSGEDNPFREILGRRIGREMTKNPPSSVYPLLTAGRIRGAAAAAVLLAASFLLPIVLPSERSEAEIIYRHADELSAAGSSAGDIAGDLSRIAGRFDDSEEEPSPKELEEAGEKIDGAIEELSRRAMQKEGIGNSGKLASDLSEMRRMRLDDEEIRSFIFDLLSETEDDSVSEAIRESFRDFSGSDDAGAQKRLADDIRDSLMPGASDLIRKLEEAGESLADLRNQAEDGPGGTGDGDPAAAESAGGTIDKDDDAGDGGSLAGGSPHTGDEEGISEVNAAGSEPAEDGPASDFEEKDGGVKLALPMREGGNGRMKTDTRTKGDETIILQRLSGIRISGDKVDEEGGSHIEIPEESLLLIREYFTSIGIGDL